jgi:glutamyl-tRNA reductase
MQIGVLGISYKSSDLPLREIVAKACQQCLANDCLEAARLSVVLLSTCNRTEIYFSASDLAEAHSDLLSLLRAEMEIPFEQSFYSFFGVECFAHLAKVISGFDSAIFGETEIQRQVKIAYAAAAAAYSLTAPLHFLFQKCLKVGKEIRTHFSLPRGVPTLESLIFELSQSATSFLFIGNSEINRKIISFFKTKKIDEISLCTHHISAAQEMPLFTGVKLIAWRELSRWQDYEIIVSGSSHSEYLLVAEQIDVQGAFKTRFIFDLSMPRTVDPKLTRHPQMHLLNIQDLGSSIALKRRDHLQDIGDAEKKLRVSVERQIGLFHLKEKKSYLCA